MEGKQTDLTQFGVIDLPKIDVAQYSGRKVRIEAVLIEEGKYGQYAKFITEPVDILKIKDKDGNFLQLRASKIFGLAIDANGKAGWGAETKLGKFASKYNCKCLGDFIGKEVTTNVITNLEDDKEYLSII